MIVRHYALHASGGNRIQGDADHQHMATNSLAYSKEKPWEAPVTEATKAAWYKVIHDIFPTNVRLFRIRMMPTNACRKSDRTNTPSRRLIECGEGEQIWTRTKCLAWILQAIPERIPSDWLLRPHFTLWPTKRRHAVL